jgi:hypothetical protein
MTFATLVNVVLAALCVIVVVQCLRMMKAVRDLKDVGLDKGVAQLETATANAQAVLTELKTVLGQSLNVQNRTLVEGEALRDELSVMVGIGNAVAERIVDAVGLEKAEKQAKAQKNRRNQSKAKTDAAPKAKSEAAPKPKAESAPQAKVEPATATIIEVPTPVAASRSNDRRSRSRSGGHRRTSNKLIEQPVKAPTTNTVGQA